MGKSSRAIIALAIGGALLPWLAAPWWPVRDMWNDFKWPVLQALVVAVSALFLIEFKSGSFDLRSRVRATSLFTMSAVLIIWGLALSAFLSAAPTLGFRILVREVSLVSIALILAWRGISAAELRVGFLVFLVSAFAQASLILVQWIGILAPEGTSGRAAMVGTFGNPEYAAGWLAPIGVAAGAWLITSSQPNLSPARIAIWIVVAMIGLALFLGGGRGAALSAIVALLLVVLMSHEAAGRRFAWRRWGNSAFFFIGGLVVLIVIGTVTPSLRQSLPGRLIELFDPYSISTRHRIGLMTVTAEMIKRDPIFGSGPGLFAAEFDKVRGRMAEESDEAGVWVFNEIMGDQTAEEAHCDPLQWWAEYGILAFIGLILVISSALSQAWRMRGTVLEDRIQAVLFAALATMTLGMFFSFPLHRPDRAILFWLLIGVVQGIYRPAPVAMPGR